MKRFSQIALSTVASIVLMSCSSGNPPASDTISLQQLEQEFLTPPNSSRPRTWFHAMSGNMSKAGITKDLESIKSAGIGGVLLFNVTQGIPIGPVKFNSDEHLELIRHMARESERLGLSFGVHNCDGWTSSGGPWISPENSMKKVVWSETYSRGGAVDIVLAEPDSFEGYYEDIATIAYPTLPGEFDNQDNLPTFSSSQADLDMDVITDGVVSVLRATTLLDGTEESPGTLDIEYAKPFTLHSLNLRFENQRLANVLLLSSQDGINYDPVQHLELRRPGKDDWGHDEALAEPVTARYFRLETKVPLALKEVSLSAVPSLGNMWGRIGAAQTTYGKLPPIGEPAQDSIIDSGSVLNLSPKMDAGGRLIADLPPGDWTIMRFGQTSTGAWNLPASEEGIGLEVDKFSQAALKVHYDAHMGKVVSAVKDVAPNAHQYTIIDSYEVGAQNWTTSYDAIFEDKKGYDLTPFLPLFAGRFVDSPEASERVTWDMRDLSNTLMVDNYYGYFKQLANADGLQLYIEPYGDGPFNEIDAGGKADIPMGEFWVNRFGNRVNVAVSSAGIYGKPIVSAEAFTDIWDVNWKMHPGYVKTLGDTNWALGVNEFMFHRFAHQANTHVKPGMTMNRWGSHFDRTQTWWDSAGKDWFAYISRGQHLLRQGIPVNDALLFVGDGSPSICPDKEKTDLVPMALNFLCLNSDVLQNRLTAEGGAFVLPEGGAHKFIILDDSETMTRESLDALDQLSERDAGFVIGAPPEHLAGFDHTANAREDFKAQVAKIWSRESVITSDQVTEMGWEAFLNSVDYLPDLTIDGQPEALFTHRKIGDHDIYFIYNPKKEPTQFTAKFRVTGKKVSLWNPMSGAVDGVQAYRAMADHTTIDIALKAQESTFVVFDGAAPLEDTVINPASNESATVSLSGPWSVQFDPDYGTDKTVEFARLTDWKDHSDPDVQHYSGPAVYQTNFEITDEFLDSGGQFMLDLGDVQVAATVSVNGVEQGTSWIAPHHIDISGALKGGENSISISVVNLWVNRLIGDAALPDLDGFRPADWIPQSQMPKWYSENKPPNLGERVTFTTADFYDASDPLIPSGLIGPVRVIALSDP